MFMSSTFMNTRAYYIELMAEQLVSTLLPISCPHQLQLNPKLSLTTAPKPRYQQVGISHVLGAFSKEVAHQACRSEVPFGTPRQKRCMKD